jgi:hypothetical protein
MEHIFDRTGVRSRTAAAANDSYHETALDVPVLMNAAYSETSAHAG